MSDFVVTMATNIITSVKTLANRVSKPSKINVPQTISNVPTNAPRNSGDGSPIFSNRPAPSWRAGIKLSLALLLK